jgi:hypothetical protein
LELEYHRKLALAALQYCVASLEDLPVAVHAKSYNGEHWWFVTCMFAIRQDLTEIWDGLRGRIPWWLSGSLLSSRDPRHYSNHT